MLLIALAFATLSEQIIREQITTKCVHSLSRCSRGHPAVTISSLERKLDWCMLRSTLSTSHLHDQERCRRFRHWYEEFWTMQIVATLRPSLQPHCAAWLPPGEIHKDQKRPLLQGTFSSKPWRRLKGGREHSEEETDCEEQTKRSLAECVAIGVQRARLD